MSDKSKQFRVVLSNGHEQIIQAEEFEIRSDWVHLLEDGERIFSIPKENLFFIHRPNLEGQ